MAFHGNVYPKIVRLDRERCIVIPPGGSAILRERSGSSLDHDILQMTLGCVVTVRGYVPDAPPLWPGAVPERLHPWPLPQE